MFSGAAKVVVVGSINMDLVARTPQIPKPGQTVSGRDFATVPGGKGANQAVAAARLGASVLMIGRVGDDPFGRTLMDELQLNNVDADHVQITANQRSGVAMICVDDAGQNVITVVAGANGQLSVSDVAACEEQIASADVVLGQLEVRPATVAAAFGIAQRHEVMTVLDPAPAPADSLPVDLMQADVLSPNLTEAEQLAGISADVDGPERLAQELSLRISGTVVLKLGADGAMIAAEGQVLEHVAAFKVRVVDTTAAGDAFTAALAVGRAEGMDMAAAVRWACAAGGLAATGHGAQPSMPDREAIRTLLEAEDGPS